MGYNSVLRIRFRCYYNSVIKFPSLREGGRDRKNQRTSTGHQHPSQCEIQGSLNIFRRQGDSNSGSERPHDLTPNVWPRELLFSVAIINTIQTISIQKETLLQSCLAIHLNRNFLVKKFETPIDCNMFSGREQKIENVKQVFSVLFLVLGVITSDHVCNTAP